MEWIDGFKIDQIKNNSEYNIKQVISSIIEVFANQIFQSGFVHCDPHPGNILIRKINGNDQIVLLDFGLCIQMTETFKMQYCQFWKAIFQHDLNSIREITHQWGVRNSEVFVSGQTMRPFSSKRDIKSEVTKQDLLEMQLKFKADLKDIIKDTSALPKEIVFVNRNMNYVRALNKMTDCSVNRVNFMAKKAFDTLTTNES